MFPIRWCHYRYTAHHVVSLFAAFCCSHSPFFHFLPLSSCRSQINELILQNAYSKWIPIIWILYAWIHLTKFQYSCSTPKSKEKKKKNNNNKIDFVLMSVQCLSTLHSILVLLLFVLLPVFISFLIISSFFGLLFFLFLCPSTCAPQSSWRPVTFITTMK